MEQKFLEWKIFLKIWVHLAMLSSFSEILLSKFAIFYAALVLSAAITMIIPNKDDGDMYLKVD